MTARHTPHDPATCQPCETDETTYAVTLSVVVTLCGAPACHTPAIIRENVLDQLAAGDATDLDSIAVVRTGAAT